ncbi:aldo/keto reductase [Haloferax sp. ATB1]|uniref:aldo/keto reductase n=1 Tax=Haloferax sp. ATB1 TaxID=1508454 RepID=UPI000694119C|nr:aldo/keto reductase [Haloferax sp. ATB1]
MVFSEPRVGFGTWQNTDPDTCAESVRTALEMGYRHIDTAQLYENEAYVGDGIERADVDREEITLGTKLWPGDLASDRVHDAVDESLERLGVDYVDILYVHWPAKDYDAVDTLGAFSELRDEGLIRHLGVSNFTPELLDEAQAACDAPIDVNQVELHPLLPQPDLLEYCRGHDIEVVAYSPLARGKVFEIPEITDIARENGLSEAQVAIAWLLSKDGVNPIPKASSEAHIRGNLEATDVELTAEELDRIDDINRELRIADRDWVDW